MISRKPIFSGPASTQGKSLIGDWLKELEERRQREFLRKTGLDYHIFLNHILESLDLTAAKLVIEINAGTGLVASHIARLVTPDVKIIGADLDQSELDTARLDAQSARLGMRVEWKKLTPGLFQFQDGSADAIACAPSENGIDTSTLIRQAARILRESGCLAFASRLESGTEGKLTRGLRAVTSRIRTSGGNALQGSEKIADQLRNAGFRQVLVRTTGARTSESQGEFMLIKAVR